MPTAQPLPSPQSPEQAEIYIRQRESVGGLSSLMTMDDVSCAAGCGRTMAQRFQLFGHTTASSRRFTVIPPRLRLMLAPVSDASLAADIAVLTAQAEHAGNRGTAAVLAVIPAVCRHFLASTGWSLSFVPETTKNRSVAASPAPAGSSTTLPSFGSNGFSAPKTDAIAVGQNSSAAANSRQIAAGGWMSELDDGEWVIGALHLPATPASYPSCSETAAVQFVGVIAGLLSSSLASARSLETRNTDLSTLVHLGLSVPAQQNLPWALTQLLRASVELTSSWSSAFFLLDSTVSRLKLRAVYQVDRDEMPGVQRTLSSRSPDFLALSTGPITVSASRADDRAFLPANVQSAMCVAVESDTVPIGTMWVYDRRERAYASRERHVLQSIAAQFAAVLERSALLRESAESGRISRELRLASECEPNQSLNSLPVHTAFQVAAKCVSCYELGGDLVEFLPVSTTNDRFGIGLGDASGNSIPAAMIMSAVRGALRTHPADGDEVTSMMRRLNRALNSITRSNQFMSLCYGVLDAERKTFTYSNAGHPVPLWLHKGEVVRMESHGLLLGVLDESEYDSSTLQLESGDFLVFYSDGISEARSAQQRLFRTEGIAETLRNATATSAVEMLRAIWEKAENHMRGGEPADDRALMIVRIN